MSGMAAPKGRHLGEDAHDNLMSPGAPDDFPVVGDGTGLEGDAGAPISSMPGIAPDGNGNFCFADRHCRGGQNNSVIRTDGTLAPCFPTYPAQYYWGTVMGEKMDASQLSRMKKACQKHCFSTLNHNLAYCCNDARVGRFCRSGALQGRRTAPSRPRMEPVVDLPEALARDVRIDLRG